MKTGNLDSGGEAGAAGGGGGELGGVLLYAYAGGGGDSEPKLLGEEEDAVCMWPRLLGGEDAALSKDSGRGRGLLPLASSALWMKWHRGP